MQGMNGQMGIGPTLLVEDLEVCDLVQFLLFEISLQ